MYHSKKPLIKNLPRRAGCAAGRGLVQLFLALLVRDCAGSLAGRLARGLAFAAAALRGGFLQIGFVKRFNVLHGIFFPFMRHIV
jgi:hypothetical protein